MSALIENLNALSFAGLGDVLQNWPDGEWPAATEQRTIAETQRELVRYRRGPVWLRRESGMPVLLIEGAGGGAVRQFYLDKPVRLRPDVWFAIATLGDGVVEQALTAERDREVKALPQIPDSLLIAPSLVVESIYTLFYQERERGFFFPGEQHTPYELVYVDKGELHSVASGRESLLRQGQLALYGPGQWHMQYGSEEKPVSFFTVSFSMRFAQADGLTCRTISAGNAERELLSRMLSEQERQGRLYADMIVCHLQELLVRLWRRENGAGCEGVGSPHKNTRENELIEAAQRYVSDHVWAHLSVEDVAKGVNVSASHMTALFRRHLQISPARYIQRVKLATGKELIASGAHTLTEIASMLGYATLPHFSRSFKETYGVAPSEYARAMR